MAWTRGPKDDFDRMAKVTGDLSWSFESMLPYLKKTEHWSTPQDTHDTKDQFNPSFHGSTGNIRITPPNHPTSIDERVIKTLGTVPGFDYVQDINSGNPLGFGWLQSTTGGGVRTSAATGY